MIQYPYIYQIDSLNLVYVNSPRCACTSTKLLLTDLMGIDFDKESCDIHNAFMDILPSIKKYQDIQQTNSDYYKFTVVRNPYARVVSFYVGKGGGAISREIYNYVDGDTFRNFVRKIYDLGMGNFEEHLIEQYKGFRVEYMDTVICLESYTEGIKQITDMFDKDVGVLWKNQSGKEDYREYYDNETKQMVRELYSTDLEMLGYEF